MYKGPPQVHSQKGNFMLLHTALFLYYSLMDTVVISPPKKVQRYDDGDAPEVQSTQPVIHAEVYVSVSCPVSEKVLKPV